MTQINHRAGRLVPLLAVLVLPVLVLAGCFGDSGRPDKAAVSGLWVGHDELDFLEPSMTARIADAGIREIFLPLAELDLEGDQGPLVRRPLPELEPSMRLNVVVDGKLALGGRDPEPVAEAVGQAVQQMLFDIEARGLVPVGVHFDLRTIDSVEIGTVFFKKLRDLLDPSFFLSFSLRRSWMKNPEIASMAKAVDFVVPFLYGQRAWERDSEQAWDFSVLQERLAELEGYKVPYMVGIIGIGNATHKGKGGKVKAFSSKQSLSPFLWNRALKLKRGFSLQSANRRVYTVVAERPTKAGGWEIDTGDEVRLIRPVSADIDDLLELLASAGHAHRIGELFYRLPAPDERMSLTLENILNAIAAEPPTPDLEFDVEVARRTRRGLMFRFLISNLNGETTEFSLLDNNYIQVTADEDAFGDIEIGDFYRYDLMRAKADGTFDRTYRKANVVRLHIPVLEGQRKVSSGDVEIRGRSPVFRVEAKFMTPDGRTLDFGPYTWQDGQLHGKEERSEDGEDGEDGEPTPTEAP